MWGRLINEVKKNKYTQPFDRQTVFIKTPWGRTSAPHSCMIFASQLCSRRQMLLISISRFNYRRNMLKDNFSNTSTTVPTSSISVLELWHSWSTDVYRTLLLHRYHYSYLSQCGRWSVRAGSCSRLLSFCQIITEKETNSMYHEQPACYYRSLMTSSHDFRSKFFTSNNVTAEKCPTQNETPR